MQNQGEEFNGYPFENYLRIYSSFSEPTDDFGNPFCMKVTSALLAASSRAASAELPIPWKTIRGTENTARWLVYGSASVLYKKTNFISFS